MQWSDYPIVRQYLVGLCLTLSMFFVCFTTLQADQFGHYFSAPYSGQKVTEYKLSLPTSRTERKEFNIPQDCEAIQGFLLDGVEQWGNRVERSIWHKVRQDCDYISFLYNFPRPPLYDYVSGYDFMNAELGDLPMGIQCKTTADGVLMPGQDTFPPGVPDISQLFPWVKQEFNTPLEPEQLCRIRNGIFRGQVIYDKTGIRCEADPNGHGFRVIAVDFSDVNGDNYQDAILRLIPLGRGLARAPLILPVTRTEPDGIFSIPQNLPTPVPKRDPRF